MGLCASSAPNRFSERRDVIDSGFDTWIAGRALLHLNPEMAHLLVFVSENRTMSKLHAYDRGPSAEN